MLHTSCRLDAAAQLVHGGVPLDVLVSADCFSADVLRQSCAFTAKQLADAGVPLSKLLSAGFVAADFKAANLHEPGALLASDGQFEEAEVLDAFRLQPRALATERASLMAIFFATGGSTWQNHSGWGEPIDSRSGALEKQLAMWFGVEVRKGHVVGLCLPENNLDGSLPACIGLLTQVPSDNRPSAPVRRSLWGALGCS